MWRYLIGFIAGVALTSNYPEQVDRARAWAATETAPVLERAAAGLRGQPIDTSRPWEPEPNVVPPAYRANGRPVPLHQ